MPVQLQINQPVQVRIEPAPEFVEATIVNYNHQALLIRFPHLTAPPPAAKPQAMVELRFCDGLGAHTARTQILKVEATPPRVGLALTLPRTFSTRQTRQFFRQ